MRPFNSGATLLPYSCNVQLPAMTANFALTCAFLVLAITVAPFIS